MPTCEEIERFVGFYVARYQPRAPKLEDVVESYDEDDDDDDNDQDEEDEDGDEEDEDVAQIQGEPDARPASAITAARKNTGKPWSYFTMNHFIHYLNEGLTFMHKTREITKHD